MHIKYIQRNSNNQINEMA